MIVKPAYALCTPTTLTKAVSRNALTIHDGNRVRAGFEDIGLLSRIFEEVPRTVNELIVFMLFVWIVFGGIETGLRRSE